MLDVPISQPISDHVRQGFFDSSVDLQVSIPGSGMESFAKILEKQPLNSFSGLIVDIYTDSRSESQSQSISHHIIESSIIEIVPIASSTPSKHVLFSPFFSR